MKKLFSFTNFTLGGFTLLITLSALLSAFPMTSLLGATEHYEGLLSFYAYISLFALSSWLARHQGHGPVIKAWLGSGLVVATIGILQSAGLDLFKTPLGTWLMSPLNAELLTGQLTFQSEQTTQAAIHAYGTLYNPNVFGLYMAMLTGYSLSNMKPLGILRTLVFFSGAVLSFSRGSLVAVGLGCVLMVYLSRKHKKNPWIRPKQGLVLGLVLVTLAMGMDWWQQGEVTLKLRNMMSLSAHHEDQMIDKIKGFEIEGQRVTLYCSQTSLTVVNDGGSLRFYDDLGVALKVVAIDGADVSTFGFRDSRYGAYEIVKNGPYIRISKGKSGLYFIVDQYSLTFADANGEAVPTDKLMGDSSAVASLGFKGLERLGSGRGYIWSRTLPLLVQHPLLGHGPDSFVLAFPQEDYLGKLGAMYDGYIIIDKPHNWVLQMAVQLGSPAVILLLAMIIGLIKKNLKVDLGDHDGQDGQGGQGAQGAPAPLAEIGAIIFALIAMVFTDSYIGVMSVFWIMLGVLNGSQYKRTCAL